MILSLTFCALVAHGQVPSMISYQGVLAASQTNITGTGHFKFALVNGAGTEVYWSNDGTESTPPHFEPETSFELAINDGLFSVMLGGDGMNPIQPSTFQNNNLLVRIWFSEDDVTFTRLRPDQPLGAVGYAMMAQRVSNGAIGENQLVNQAVTRDKLADGAVTAGKLAAASVTGDKIAAGTIVSNKLDWSTMPALPEPLKGYAESGTFAMAPTATGEDAIAMGYGAQARGENATVSGGRENEAGAARATVAGGLQNHATGFGSAVGGGAGNRAASDYTTVAGGQGNTATNNFAAVAGGEQNIASGDHSSVGGGMENSASAFAATVGGGYTNEAAGAGATVSGGLGNKASADFSTVNGGLSNTIATAANHCSIGGGRLNRIEDHAERATIAGGDRNEIRRGANTSFIGGGRWNITQTNSIDSVIGGGQGNLTDAQSPTISGGTGNRIHGGATAATVGGGWQNRIWTNAGYSTISGGHGNTIRLRAPYASIGGGAYNIISTNALGATISGGWQNTIWNNATNATIGGGLNNRIEFGSAEATIGGGWTNRVSARFATVSGGGNNRADGIYATIPGGRDNTAVNYAFAAGRSAKANHEGSFVWADATNADFASTRNNQFAVRAAGGVRISAAASGLNPAACWIESSTANGVGLHITHTSSDANLVTGNPGTGDHIKSFSGVNAGTLVFRVANNGAVTAQSFNPTSDRHAKEAFEPVDVLEILDKVAALPITTWQFKDQAAPIRHIGPMAQDFHAAFGLGDGDTSIATVNADGVALAAIQGLNRKMTALEEDNQALRQENAELRTRLKRLETALFGLSAK